MDYKRIAVVSAVVGTSIVSIILPSLSLRDKSKLYEGPLDIAGVERVEARQVHEVCAQFLCLRYAGNVVEMQFNDGSSASVRDYAGDFMVNGNDTIDGKIPANVDVNQVLDETRRKSGGISYWSLY